MVHDKGQASWPVLAARALDDMLRIVQAELRLAETRLKSILERQIAIFATSLLAIGFCLIGGVMLLAALVLLLIRVMPPWAALAAAGLASIACGWLARLAVGSIHSRERRRST
ncbi:MAG TPA: phage holin family protein [Candidatus Binataceae bacterium]|nr:phage holin family protein [Candidatus Binataceae bacterium]